MRCCCAKRIRVLNTKSIDAIKNVTKIIAIFAGATTSGSFASGARARPPPCRNATSASEAATIFAFTTSRGRLSRAPAFTRCMRNGSPSHAAT